MSNFGVQNDNVLNKKVQLFIIRSLGWFTTPLDMHFTSELSFKDVTIVSSNCNFFIAKIYSCTCLYIELFSYLLAPGIPDNSFGTDKDCGIRYRCRIC